MLDGGKRCAATLLSTNTKVTLIFSCPWLTVYSHIGFPPIAAPSFASTKLLERGIFFIYLFFIYLLFIFFDKSDGLLQTQLSHNFA